MSSNWKLGLGYSLLTAIMWGGLPIALKLILDDMDSITVTWYRFSVSAIIALLVYGRGSMSAIRRLLSPPLWPLTLLAIAGLLANYVFYILGLDHTTAEAAQILIQLAPLLLLLGSVWIFKESFSVLQWVGVLAFTLGLGMFFHHRLQAFAAMEKSYAIGMLLLFLAAGTWACYGLAQKQLLRRVGAKDLLLLVYIAGTLCFFPASTPGQAFRLDGWELAMLAFAALNTYIAYGSFGIAMANWEASRVSAVITMAPLLTLLLVYVSNLMYPGFMQSEPLDWANWLGAGLVVGGSTLAALGNRL